MMKKTKITLVLIFCISNLLFGQKFDTNSVGIVRLNRIETDSIELGISFPLCFIDSLPHDILDNPYIVLDNSKIDKHFNEFYTSDRLIIANENGEIYCFDKIKKYKANFWCENDGGASIRPYFELKIHKNDFKADLSTNALIKNIICFAVINFDKTLLKKTQFPSDKNILKKVDFDSDGKYDAYIWGEPDEAMGGLCLSLTVGEAIEIEIDCCGP